jgi:hypothetical protein
MEYNRLYAYDAKLPWYYVLYTMRIYEHEVWGDQLNRPGQSRLPEMQGATRRP